MKNETVQIQILPNELSNQKLLLELANQKTQSGNYTHFFIRKRSIDARKRPVKYNLQVILSNEPIADQIYTFEEQDVSKAKFVHIIGAGPAGLYAALQAISMGLKPIVYERGKDVRSRRRDLAKLNKDHIVNSESNYCYGEGGAGTYSDGKLYTRSKKRGNVLKAMEWLVHFGADPDILVDAHPHIGTNKLPQLIVNIRETIKACGGEIHFEAKLTDIKIENKKLTAISINDQDFLPVHALVLATGHSARDIFNLLHKKGVIIKAKPFALGVRIEHDQHLINAIQYNKDKQIELLPPASYSLVAQVKDKGVYSFCMCPGGIIAPCATAREEVVTNGWSPSKRNNPYANAGVVVTIEPEELTRNPDENPLVCLAFQQEVEKKCWEAAGKTQAVPAQRLIDFVEGKVSKDLPKTSYQPGIVSVDLNKILPERVAEPLKVAFIQFGKKMKGFYTNEAVLHAPESRTSSPVFIPREKDTLEHIETQGLYPCGEGAGYAGGIISAAVDGMNCIQAIYNSLTKNEKINNGG